MRFITRSDGITMFWAVLNPLFQYRVVVSVCIYSGPSTCVLLKGVSEQANTWPPVSFGGRLRVNDDVVREWVGVGGCDRGDVVFVTVHDANDLVCGLLERLGHGTADFDDV